MEWPIWFRSFVSIDPCPSVQLWILCIAVHLAGTKKPLERIHQKNSCLCKRCSSPIFQYSSDTAFTNIKFPLDSYIFSLRVNIYIYALIIVCTGYRFQTTISYQICAEFRQAYIIVCMLEHYWFGWLCNNDDEGYKFIITSFCHHLISNWVTSMVSIDFSVLLSLSPSLPHCLYEGLISSRKVEKSS